VREDDFAAEYSALHTEMLGSFETLTCAYQTKLSDLPKDSYLTVTALCLFIYFFIALINAPSNTLTLSIHYSIIVIFHQFLIFLQKDTQLQLS